MRIVFGIEKRKFYFNKITTDTLTVAKKMWRNIMYSTQISMHAFCEYTQSSEWNDLNNYHWIERCLRVSYTQVNIIFAAIVLQFSCRRYPRSHTSHNIFFREARACVSTRKAGGKFIQRYWYDDSQFI